MTSSSRWSLRRFAAAALDLLAPPACLACGAARVRAIGLCSGCLAQVPRPSPAPCPRCAGVLGPGVDPSVCKDCLALRPRFTAALAAGPYAGFLGELVRRAKYGRDPVLAAPLSRLLAQRVRAWPGADGVDRVIPVPGTPARSRERGFHLAELLASRAAEALGVPLFPDALRRVGEPVPQAALPRTERRLAARGTVDWVRRRFPWPTRPGLGGAVVLLVDDVLTTGSTANACAVALLAAGAAEVRVAVVARA